MPSDYPYPLPPGRTVIERLRDAHVVSIDVTTAVEGLGITEACDYYYDALLTWDDVRNLIAELQALIP